MVATFEKNWDRYASTFPDRELISFDRRGTGLSEFGTGASDPDAYLQDAQTVVREYALEEFDVIGTLLGSIEAAALAARNPERVGRLVLRAPVTGLRDWSRLPPVSAALAALEHDWVYFTESFSQLVVGWGHPTGRDLARQFREATESTELSALFAAYAQLDLKPLYAEIRAETLVEHHPEYFFPRSYSQRIASLIPDCRLVVFSGSRSEFVTDFSEARAFLAGA